MFLRLIKLQYFFDFKPYAPSHGAPASFISQAILDENGSLAGILVFQMPIAKINNVMQVAAGMGESGETYIVGKDGFMRSDSRFSDESTILKTKVTGENPLCGCGPTPTSCSFCLPGSSFFQ